MNLFSFRLPVRSIAAGLALVSAGCLHAGPAAVAAKPATAEAKRPLARWLAIGDSITQSGAPNADLKWSGPGPRGIASSEIDKDYVHVLRRLLQARAPGHAAEIKIAGRLGKLSAGTTEQMLSVIDALRAWNADLVTIQLGENDHLKEIGLEGFESRYRTLVDGVLAGPQRPRVVLCTDVWEPGTPLDPQDPGRYRPGSEGAQKEAVIEKICQDKDLLFVSIAPLVNVKANYGTGGHGAIQWHPNDAGMQAYADAMAAALVPGL